MFFFFLIAQIVQWMFHCVLLGRVLSFCLFTFSFFASLFSVELPKFWRCKRSEVWTQRNTSAENVQLCPDHQRWNNNNTNINAPINPFRIEDCSSRKKKYNPQLTSLLIFLWLFIYIYIFCVCLFIYFYISKLCVFVCDCCRLKSRIAKCYDSILL